MGPLVNPMMRILVAASLLALLLAPAATAFELEAPERPDCPGGTVGDACEFAVGIVWGVVPVVWPIIGDTVDILLNAVGDFCEAQLGDRDCG